MKFYEKYIKRALDILVSLSALIILFPLIIILSVLIKLNLGSPILFKQKRPGKDEKIFSLYKFRSMNDARDDNDDLLPDLDRVTSFGKKLRSSSLDELPELWNILKGDMSLVGPRPLAVEYLPYYSSKERKRHNVRPGLTGYAQVNGRNNIDWEERFKYDLEYVNNITFLNDIRIIFKTFKKVIKSEDISLRGTTKIDDFHTQRKFKQDE